MPSFPHKRLVLGLALAGLADLAQAAGFALVEQNASGLGNAYAGQAASAQDASTIFFNPAGMTQLPDRQVVVVGHLIKPKMEFSGTVSPAVGGGEGGDAGSWSFVPNGYFAYRLTPKVHLGVGLNSPFGLKTEYDPGWVGRYQAIKSELKTVNVNPSIAYKVSDTLSVGAGVSVQRIDAELTNLTGVGLAKVEGDDYGWGFNLGALWQVAQNTRLGVSYRSRIDYKLDGSASFSGMPALNGNITADVTLPDSASLSVFQKLSQQWDLLADVSWTGWGKFDKLAIYRTSGALLSYTPENWQDVLRYSLGATWHMSEKLSLRGGIAYDEAPVSDRHRTPRIPDGARTWVAVGGQYKLSRQGAVDIGYAHLFVNDPGLNAAVPATAITPANTLNGQYDSQVDILSVQYAYSF
ncbi:MAG: OmpP1/FadL family transporter [Hyphomicrobiaceae bacterium]